MLPNEFIYLIGTDRHRELLREAEKDRLARQALEAQKRVVRFSNVLAWLGRRLVVWGRHLEERYSTEPRPLHSGM